MPSLYSEKEVFLDVAFTSKTQFQNSIWDYLQIVRPVSKATLAKQLMCRRDAKGTFLERNSLSHVPLLCFLSFPILTEYALLERVKGEANMQLQSKT